jgi:hypothetical protein
MMPSSPLTFQRSLLSTLFVLGTLAVSLYAISKSNYGLLTGLIALLFLPLLIQNPSWLLMLTIGLYGADITLPMLPAALSLHSFLAGSLAAWLIIRKLIAPQTFALRHGHFASTLFLFLYLATLVMIMIVRGTGMRFMGSDLWGGGKYFTLMIAMAFFWTASTQSLSSRQWKFTILMLTAGYILPFASQWFISISGGRVDLSPYLSTVLADPNVDITDLQTTLVRVFPLGNFGIALGLGALLLIPVRLPHVIGQGILLLIAMILIGLSGFRSHFLILGGTMILYSFLLQKKGARKRHLLMILLAGACFWAFLYLITPFLPPLMHRTLSIVPGLGIGTEAQTNAMGTVTWRIDLWKFSLQMADPYLWIGRGFLYSQSELPQFDYTTGFLYMYLRHSYHNGPLSLLIDTGIPGLIFCSLFFFSTIRECFRRLDIMPASSEFGRAYRVLLAYLLVQVISFYFIIGDPMSSVVKTLFTFTLLKILTTSHQAAQPLLKPSPPS